ncbi:hypothetical protein Vretifemale_16972 [Volvox reticuliferus]|nr:hypothetical protein Vretifemale_16972 [Volvox reticuliferus]
MAVSEALSISPSTFGAGLAADDLILTLYFVSIYYLARNIPPDGAPGGSSGPQQQQQHTASGGGGGEGGGGGHGSGGKVITVGCWFTGLSGPTPICPYRTVQHITPPPRASAESLREKPWPLKSHFPHGF